MMPTQESLVHLKGIFIIECSATYITVRNTGKVCLFVCYLTTLSASKLYICDNNMLNECEAAGGMRIGRGNLP
jgi:hypothetical protein